MLRDRSNNENFYMKKLLRLAALLFIWMSAACTLPTTMTRPAPTLVMVTTNPNASQTPTPFQPAAGILAPVEAATLIPSFTPLPPTNTPLPTLAFTATALPSLTSAPPSARTQYTLYALLDYAGHQLGADETVRYTNQTGVALNELVMAVEPNLRGGFLLENVMLAGNPLTYDHNGQQLTVHLPQGLAPGAQATLTMRFRIDIPAKVKEHPYGYDVDQVNLTDWYPFIVPYSNGWILHDPSPLGEHLV